MDEPEHHLHPDACMQVVERTIEAAGSFGQVWIATHSLALIAGLLYRYRDEVSLYSMKREERKAGDMIHIGGNPKFGGRTPSDVILSLMGGEDQIDALRDFLKLPVIWQMNDFSAWLAVPTKVVGQSPPTDPQVLGLLEKLVARNSSKVLDFGAGRGRLPSCLRSMDRPELAGVIDYYAYDLFDDHRLECQKAVRSFYDKLPGKLDEQRLYFGHEIAAIHDKHAESFDNVILCNVLHEIDPRDWAKLLGSDGVVSRLLKEDGELFIVEDYEMPEGEMAHSFGFIVLDEYALAELFPPLRPEDICIHAASVGTTPRRVRVQRIAKSALRCLSFDTIRNSLQKCIQMAQDNISALRTELEESLKSPGRNLRGPDQDKHGRRYGYWAHQLLNCQLALKHLQNSPSDFEI